MPERSVLSFGDLSSLKTHRSVIAVTRCGALAIALLVASVGVAQTVTIPRDRHAWGRFVPGSWTKVGKVTEEFNAEGQATNVSTTETTTTLVAVDDRGFTLQYDVAVELAGKRFAAQPKTVRLGYLGEGAGEAWSLRKIATDALDLGGRKTPCDVLEAIVGDGASRIVSLIYYSERVAPYVLKRETKSLGSTPEQPPRQQTVVEVMAVDMPYRVLGEIKTVAYVRTIQRTAKGSTVTVEVCCPEVPGGVVAHTSKECDDVGQTLRRSTLELRDYGTSDTSEPRHFWFRTRPRRSGTSPTP